MYSYIHIYNIYTHIQRKRGEERANKYGKMLITMSESRWVFAVLLLQLFYAFEMLLSRNFREKSKISGCWGPTPRNSNITGLGCSLDIWT